MSMRIVIVVDWFAEQMGYAENFLPRSLAKQGYEVHVVTSNVQPYFNSPTYKTTYEPFIGPPVVKCGTKQHDGYTLHRLQHGFWRERLRIKGLLRTIRALKPQIVQTFTVISPSTYELVLAKPALNYKLFVGSHVHASVFPPAKKWFGIRSRFKWIRHAATIGRLVSLASEKCYTLSRDAADIAIEFFGMEIPKVTIAPLGVNTDLFTPNRSQEDLLKRQTLRQEFGYTEHDIVCIYTGRFSSGKDPLSLAQAIDLLSQRDEGFKGFFVGDGPQSDAIQTCCGCQVHPFVPVQQLPSLYRMADIGVWPKQESTSQLDAMACGLPLVVSNRIEADERVDGNGLTYKENDSKDLAEVLQTLEDKALREKMGSFGAQKVQQNYSWDFIATQRIGDYKKALKS